MPEYATAARLSTDYNNTVCDLQREIALSLTRLLTMSKLQI